MDTAEFQGGDIQQGEHLRVMRNTVGLLERSQMLEATSCDCLNNPKCPKFLFYSLPAIAGPFGAFGSNLGKSVALFTAALLLLWAFCPAPELCAGRPGAGAGGGGCLWRGGCEALPCLLDLTVHTGVSASPESSKGPDPSSTPTNAYKLWTCQALLIDP